MGKKTQTAKNTKNSPFLLSLSTPPCQLHPTVLRLCETGLIAENQGIFGTQDSFHNTGPNITVGDSVETPNKKYEYSTFK